MDFSRKTLNLSVGTCLLFSQSMIQSWAQPYNQPGDGHAGWGQSQPAPSGWGQPGYGGYNQYPVNVPRPVRQGRVCYVPAGMMFPVTLQTAISTQVVRPGDMIQATISEPISLGNGTIPAGSQVIGQIADAKSGSFMGRSGLLEVSFTRLRTPDGVETPISAHVVGGIGRYKQAGGAQSGTVRGEGMTAKFGQAAIRGGLGAGVGAALGTAIGAIAGRGRGAGRGAWSGAAVGGGLGVADSVLLRKGRDVLVPSGTRIQLQLDAPATVSGAPQYGTF